MYCADQVRLHEKQAAKNVGKELYDLMKAAGCSVFEHCLSLYPNTHNYLVLVGSGNNAGDGYITALCALKAGKNVKVCAIEPDRRLKGDAAKAQAAFKAAGGIIHAFTNDTLNKAELVIDALLGTGVVGDIRPEFSNIINWLNQCNVPVVSVDLPSGLDANTGACLSTCIQASTTITFVGIKLGLTTGNGKQACGHLVFDELDIGDEFNELAQSDASLLKLEQFSALSPRAVHSHKGSHGKLLCIGGNQGMSGAIRLSAEAALRSGAAMVKVYTHADSILQVSSGRPELMVISRGLKEALAWSTCIVIGPGLGRDHWAKAIFEEVLKHAQQESKAIVLDADALYFAAERAEFFPLHNCVITPHAGEAARLLNLSVEALEANRFKVAREAALRYYATCVLKGAGTIVDNQKHAWVCSHGNPGMASAGMGDVLAGVIGALISQGLHKDMATQFAVSIHAKAGDIVAKKFGQRGIIASDMFDTIRTLINE